MFKLLDRIIVSDCPKSMFSHSYRSKILAGGIWHQGAIGRNGKMCDNCLDVVYDESDREWLKGQPVWLLKLMLTVTPDRSPLDEIKTGGTFSFVQNVAILLHADGVCLIPSYDQFIDHCYDFMDTYLNWSQCERQCALEFLTKLRS